MADLAQRGIVVVGVRARAPKLVSWFQSRLAYAASLVHCETLAEEKLEVVRAETVRALAERERPDPVMSVR